MEWIKCSVRTPDAYIPVRVKTLTGREGFMYHAFKWNRIRSMGSFRVCDVKYDVITHWKPISQYAGYK